MATDRPKVHVVTTDAEWSRLAPQWDALRQSVDGATALQSYNFLRSWWKHFGHDKRLRIITVTNEDKLLGIAPLQLARRRMYRKQYRVLEFLGMPDELDRPHILVPEGDEQVLRLLLSGAGQFSEDWDLIQLDELDSAGWQASCVANWAKQQRLGCRSEPLHPVPFLEKSGSWEDFVRGKSRRFGKRLRYLRRRVERDHELSYRWSHGPGLHAELLDEFFAIEAKSWKAQKGYDVGSEAGYRDFYVELLGTDSSAMRGHIVVQYIDSVPSAATFGFSSGRTYHSLQIAQDSRFDRFSPGTLLEAFEMQWFFENSDLRRYELLGGEGSNKRRWASGHTDTCVIRVYRPNLRFAAANTYKRLRRLLAHRD